MRYDFKVRFTDRIVEDNIGQLIAMDAILARDGTYQYSSDEVFGDGRYDTVTLHRDWEDVKKLKATLEGKPVIHYHTARGVDITIDNIDEYKVGHLQNVRESKAEGYNVLIGDLFITNKDVIEKILSGELREISLGYFYTIDDSDRNKIKQVDMVAEHIALVDHGRAGISKILDSNNYFYLLAYPDKKNPDIMVYQTNPKDGSLELNYPWRDVIGEGWVKGQSYPGTLSVGSLLPLQIATMIVSKLALNAVLVDSQGIPRYAYRRGRKTDLNAFREDGFQIDMFEGLENDELGDYEIPDESGSVEDLPIEENNYEEHINLFDHKAVVNLHNELKSGYRKIDNAWKDNKYDTGFGKAYHKMWMLRDEIKRFLQMDLTHPIETDNQTKYQKYDQFISLGNNGFKTAARDEEWLPILLVKFDEEKTNIEIVNGIKEAAKKTKSKLDNEISIDESISIINDTDGYFAMIVPIKEYAQLIVTTALSNENVMVEVFENIDEANQELSDYFSNIEEAFAVISSKRGRYVKSDAVIV